MLGRAISTVNQRFFLTVIQRFGRRAVIWGAILTALALLLDFVPLFDLLGYDFSIAVGLCAMLAAVDIGQGVVAAARKRAAEGGEPVPDLWRLTARALAGGLAILVMPLLLSLLDMVRVRNCSVSAGLGFYALLPLATVLYAAPAGVLAGLCFPRRGRLVAFLLPVVSVLWTLLRLYQDPALFALDPFGGYFPGPIYDEALRPPLRLLLYRVANLVWITTALTLAAAALGRGRDPRAWRRPQLAIAAVLIAASIALFASRGRLGFHIQRSDLVRALPGERHTAHFVVHYDPDPAQGYAPLDIALMLEDLEFRYEQLRQRLGTEPRGPITVWEFPSSASKRSLVGAGDTLFARPWTREIFVHGYQFPSRPLRHEMAHVFAGTFGDPLLGISLAWRWHGPLPLPTLATGLIEGIAEAADAGAEGDQSTIHQQAAAMIVAGNAPPLATIMGAGFSGQSGARAYTIAGSFCRFLLESRGGAAMKQLYRSAGDFVAAYGVPLATLEAEWRDFLARQPVDAQDRARASEQFRRPAIFKKVCARELAARLAEARALRATYTAPARMAALLEEICADDPHEPMYRLSLIDARAAAGDVPRALELAKQMESDGDLTLPMQASVANLAGILYFQSGDYANAEAAERRVLKLSPDAFSRRLAYSRLRALAQPNARQTLGRALFGDRADFPIDPVLVFHLINEFARLYPRERLGPYLIGRQLLSRDAAHALPYLQRACGETPGAAAPAADEALPPDFVLECRRMTAEAAYRAGDFAHARAAAQSLATTSEREAERASARDMLERIAWAERQPRAP
jgi:tetratricopeptide (TPR) repeat protein